MTLCCINLSGRIQCRKCTVNSLSLFLPPLLLSPFLRLYLKLSFPLHPSSSTMRPLERCFQMYQRWFYQQMAQSQLECCSTMSCERTGSHRTLLSTWCVLMSLYYNGGGGGIILCSTRSSSEQQLWMPLPLGN